MAANSISALRAFGTSVLRLGASLTVAFVLTGVVASIAYWAYTYQDRTQARAAEASRQWTVDMSSNLSMKVQALTKLEDGVMRASVQFLGAPEYLSYPENQSRGFVFKWADGDGFVRVSKPLLLSEFTKSVDAKGQTTGLSVQFEQAASLHDYEKLQQLQVEWTVSTEAPKRPPMDPLSLAQLPSNEDPCAPGLSRAERLKRLARFGQVRETGLNEFTAGSHRVVFAYAAEVMTCE